MADNAQIAQHLKQIAELKSIDGANRFSIAAYQDAAKKVEQNDLSGLGTKTAKTIKQFIGTGTSDAYDELAQRLPVECLSMTVVRGIGAKKAYAFWKDGIKDFPALIKAAESGLVNEKVAKAVFFARDVKSGRIPREDVGLLATLFRDTLRGEPGVIAAEICGSYRRKRDTVKDLDAVVALKSDTNIIPLLGSASKIADALDTKSFFSKLSKTLKGDAVSGEPMNDGIVKREFSITAQHCPQIKVDIWVVDVCYWGSAVAYATGSKFHNLYLRDAAIRQGMKINEYGIFSRDNGKRLGGEQEKDLYDILGFDYVEPENREQ